MKLQTLGIRLVRNLPVIPTATLYLLAIDLASIPILGVALLLHAMTMQATGRALHMLLGAGALPVRPNNPPELIVVPTAGAYQDNNGRWWPSRNTYKRVAEAVSQYDRIGAPLVVVGRGKNVAEGEATVASRHFCLDGAGDVIVLAEGDTTDSSAQAVARLAEQNGTTRVLLITDSAHVARMAACLRRRAIDVDGLYPRPHWRIWAMPRYFVPDTSGSVLMQRAMYEILAIAGYLLQNKFRPQHLLPSRPVWRPV